MSIGPDLFHQDQPPEIVIRFHPADVKRMQEDRSIEIRIKPFQARQVVGFVVVDRYSPEWSIMLAISHLFQDLAELGRMPNALELRELLEANAEAYIEPF